MSLVEVPASSLAMVFWESEGRTSSEIAAKLVEGGLLFERAGGPQRVSLLPAGQHVHYRLLYLDVWLIPLMGAVPP